jgi:hypothetical protein
LFVHTSEGNGRRNLEEQPINKKKHGKGEKLILVSQRNFGKQQVASGNYKPASVKN